MWDDESRTQFVKLAGVPVELVVTEIHIFQSRQCFNLFGDRSNSIIAGIKHLQSTRDVQCAAGRGEDKLWTQHGTVQCDADLLVKILNVGIDSSQAILGNIQGLQFVQIIHTRANMWSIEIRKIQFKGFVHIVFCLVH